MIRRFHGSLRAFILVAPLALAMMAHHASFFARAPHWHGSVEHIHAGGGLTHMHVHDDTPAVPDRESALPNTFFAEAQARHGSPESETLVHTHDGRTHAHSHEPVQRPPEHRHTAPHNTAPAGAREHEQVSGIPGAYFSAVSAPMLPAPVLVVSAAYCAPTPVVLPIAGPISAALPDATAIRDPPPHNCS